MKLIPALALLLAFTATSIFAQMKSAPLDPNAWYAIIAVHSGKALEVAPSADGKAKAPILQQNERTSAPNQLFQFKQVQSGYFQITVKHSGKVLEIRDSSLMDHAPVQQGEPTGKENQHFALVKETSGNYRIIAHLSGFGFDVSGGVKATGNNNPVIVYPATGATNQTFQLIEVP